MMEGVYSRTEYIREGRKLRKYKESSRGIQKKIKCRSKMTKEVGFGREKRV